MKKMIIFAGALFFLCMSAITAGVVLMQKNGSDSLFTIEALAQGEETFPKDWYNLKAVGCGSSKLHDYIVYCCPGYEETCSAQSCTQQVYGCSN